MTKHPHDVKSAERDRPVAGISSRIAIRANLLHKIIRQTLVDEFSDPLVSVTLLSETEAFHAASLIIERALSDGEELP